MAKAAQTETLFKDDAAPKVAQPKTATAVGKPPAKRKAATKKPGREVAVHKPQPAPISRYQLVANLAANPQVDESKMQALLKMLKEEEQLEAERLFDEAMLAAQSEMPPLPRDSYNTHTKAWWARIEGVAAKMDPIIRKHGFTLSYGMGEPRMPDHFYVFADVTWRGKDDNGKKLSCTRRWGLDMGRDDVGAKGGGTKTGAQGSVSVLTYGRRNLKMAVFDVVPLGMDRDGNPAGREPISAEQLKDLKKQLKETNIPENAVCEHYKVNKIDNISVGQLPSLLERIEQKRRTVS